MPILNHPTTILLCFPDAESWERWTRHNCAKCAKNSHLKPDGTYTNIKCSVQRDVFNQALGKMEILESSYRTTQTRECPLFRMRLRQTAPLKTRPLPRAANMLVPLT